MIRRLALPAFLMLALPLGVALTAATLPGDPVAAPALGHMVYFKLKDPAPAAREKLIAACKTHLTGHSGTLFFGTGIVAADLDREVNDRDWDVALHLVFKDKASHDLYHEHPRHLRFIEENRENWAKVRVFDSYLAESGASAAPASVSARP